MPARAALLYLQSKYVHETRFETYVADMLWAPANGMQFKNGKRYGELVQQQHRQQLVSKKSGDEILDDVLAQWENA